MSIFALIGCSLQPSFDHSTTFGEMSILIKAGQTFLVPPKQPKEKARTIFYVSFNAEKGRGSEGWKMERALLLRWVYI